jgi:hypothetical protein
LFYQVGCDTFTQLFTQYPEVLEYISDFDTMVVEGINVGDALRFHIRSIFRLKLTYLL